MPRGSRRPWEIKLSSEELGQADDLDSVNQWQYLLVAVNYFD
jgi:hypothetical protein